MRKGMTHGASSYSVTLIMVIALHFVHPCYPQCVFPEPWRGHDWYQNSASQTQFYYVYNESTIDWKTRTNGVEMILPNFFQCHQGQEDESWFRYVTQAGMSNNTYCDEGMLGHHGNGLLNRHKDLIFGQTIEQCADMMGETEFYNFYVKAPFEFTSTPCPFRAPPARTWQVTYKESPGDAMCATNLSSMVEIQDGALHIDSCYDEDNQYDKPLQGVFQCVERVSAQKLQPGSGSDDMVLLMRQTANRTDFYCARFKQSDENANLSLSLYTGSSSSPKCPGNTTASTSGDNNTALYMRELPCIGMADRFRSDPSDVCFYFECIPPGNRLRRPCSPGTAVPLNYTYGQTAPCTEPNDYCARCSFDEDYWNRHWIYQTTEEIVTLAYYNNHGIFISTSDDPYNPSLGYTCHNFSRNDPNVTVIKYTTVNATLPGETSYTCSEHIFTDSAVLERVGEPVSFSELKTIEQCHEELSLVPVYRLMIEYPVNLTAADCPFTEGNYRLSYSSTDGVNLCQGRDDSMGSVQGNTITLAPCNEAHQIIQVTAVTYTCVMTLSATVLGEADDTAGDLIVLAHNDTNSFLSARYKTDGETLYLSTFNRTDDVMECSLGVNYSTHGESTVAFVLTDPVPITNTSTTASHTSHLSSSPSMERISSVTEVVSTTASPMKPSSFIPTSGQDAASSFIPTSGQDTASSFIPTAGQDTASSFILTSSQDAASSFIPTSGQDAASSFTPTSGQDAASSFIPTSGQDAASSFTPTSGQDAASSFIPTSGQDAASSFIPTSGKDAASSFTPTSGQDAASSFTPTSGQDAASSFTPTSGQDAASSFTPTSGQDAASSFTPTSGQDAASSFTPTSMSTHPDTGTTPGDIMEGTTQRGAHTANEMPTSTSGNPVTSAISQTASPVSEDNVTSPFIISVVVIGAVIIIGLVLTFALPRAGGGQSSQKSLIRDDDEESFETFPSPALGYVPNFKTNGPANDLGYDVATDFGGVKPMVNNASYAINGLYVPPEQTFIASGLKTTVRVG